MKKLVFILILMLLLTLRVNAESVLPDISAELEAIDSSGLEQTLPDETRRQLEENQLSPQNVTGLLEFGPQQLLQTAYRQLLAQINRPLQGFASVLGVILLAALLEGLKSSGNDGQIRQVFSIISSLAICGVLAEPIISCIVDTAAAIKSCSDFVLGFVPVFAGVLTAGGQPVTASGYSLFLFWICQIISRLASTVLMPVLGIYLGFCIISAAAPQLQLASLAKGFKNLVTWGMGLMLTIFVGFMTVQSIAAGSGDTVAAKTTKFLIGSFVPVVGGALSDAFIAAQGCIQLLKATLGAYGIIAAAFIFLPVVIRLGLWYLVTQAGSMASDIFDLKEASSILTAMSTTLGILLAMVMFYILLIIITTSVVLVVGQGVL